MSLLPPSYGYVALVAASSGFLTTWQSFKCGAARKASGIKYPIMAASAEDAAKNPAAMAFNCAQRAHLNTLESLPYFLFATLFAGIEYPTLAASLGAFWVANRVLYSIGYYTGNAKNRIWGAAHNIGFFGLMITATVSAVHMIQASA